MKKLMILCVLPIFFAFKAGEDIDEKKMERDLKISKNILATLIKSDSDSFFGDDAIDVSYVKGYGVIFSIPEHLVYFHSGGRAFTIPEIPPIPEIDVDFDVEFYGDFDFSEDGQVDVVEQIEDQKADAQEQRKKIIIQQKELQKNRQEIEHAREQMARAQKEAQKAVVVHNNNVFTMHNMHARETEIDWENIMITFMKDYADLIGQLDPSEKILIRQNSPFNERAFSWTKKAGGDDEENEINGNISAEVLRKDIAAYKAGKINENTFVSRIKIEKKVAQKKVADLEMFASIFDRYYSSELTETFYCQGTPRYELLEGFGVIYHIKASAGGRSYRVRQRSSGNNTWSDSDANAASDDEKLYPIFKEDLKAFMLDYGRTIRSLQDDDKVLLEIELNVCANCKIPRKLELSTKMSVLKEYDQQKLARNKALDQIEIKEII